MSTFGLTRAAHMQIAFFSRVLVGLWFFMLGRWKVFGFEGGPGAFANQVFVEAYADTFLPAALLRLAGWMTPLAELICGLCLVLGLFTRTATWILMGLLVMVTFGHQLKEPTYSLAGHVLPAAVGLAAIAALAGPNDVLSLDHAFDRMLRKRRA